ncbi:hypothetical protein F511_41431 [Dorcoceras hygrometricum]|uniref:Uncharacterized protein n=1 Tax=Dorcoceras hygrometricum TaxID=472368 RepID=A0A2Z7CY89_9LAMI|nr:hypothetical protein F511_41431 [Dorcoceras hygrometricum]
MWSRAWTASLMWTSSLMWSPAQTASLMWSPAWTASLTIAALDQFISKLQVKNKLRERECDDAKNQLRRKEEEVSRLRAKLAAVEGKEETSEEEINCKVNERTQLLRNELDRKIQDCQKMANELERRKMEQRMFQQQQEVEMLKRRLEGIESELASRGLAEGCWSLGVLAAVGCGIGSVHEEKGVDHSSSAVILNSRIAALDQFISKLQVKIKLRERECDDAKNQLRRKEEEVSRLRAKLAAVEGKEETSEEEINCKVNERTQLLRNELDRKIQDCQKMANELERRKMEPRMFQQQQEVEMLKRRLEDIESELR